MLFDKFAGERSVVGDDGVKNLNAKTPGRGART
jgi:hypothetical protein